MLNKIAKCLWVCVLEWLSPCHKYCWNHSLCQKIHNVFSTAKAEIPLGSMAHFRVLNSNRLLFHLIQCPFKLHWFNYSGNWGMSNRKPKLLVAISNIIWFFWSSVLGRCRYIVYNYLYQECFHGPLFRGARVSMRTSSNEFHGSKCWKSRASSAQWNKLVITDFNPSINVVHPTVSKTMR